MGVLPSVASLKLDCPGYEARMRCPKALGEGCFWNESALRGETIALFGRPVKSGGFLKQRSDGCRHYSRLDDVSARAQA
jgi:hypothetical protein